MLFLEISKHVVFSSFTFLDFLYHFVCCDFTSDDYLVPSFQMGTGWVNKEELAECFFILWEWVVLDIESAFR